MTPVPLTLRYTYATLLLLLLFSSTPGLANPASWNDWQHDLWGQATAQANGKRLVRPVLLYFHADWCGWCRKLDKDYLRSPALASTLALFEKAELNPEKSATNQQLFDKFGGKGFPSLYVLLPGSDLKPVKVSPFTKNRHQSATEFADKLRSTVARQFNQWGYQLEQSDALDAALEMTNKSLTFDPRNTYALSMQGRIHHRIGHQNRDLARLRLAKTAYQKALAIDPNHESSQKGLRALRNLPD